MNLRLLLGFRCGCGNGGHRDSLVEQVDELDRQREDDGGVLFDADVGEGLEIAELQGHGLSSHERGGFDELCRGVELAFGVDDLGAALALSLGLLGHGAEHVFRHVDLFDLDGDDFDAEGRRVAVNDGLDALVELVAVRENLVQFDFAEDGAESRLGELRGLVDVVGDLNDGLDWIDDAQRNDGVDLEGDVVAGNDVLRRDFHGLLAKADADDGVDRAEDEDDAGTRGIVANATETEDHGALVLFEDLDGVEEVEQDDGSSDKERHHGITAFRLDDNLAAAMIVNGYGKLLSHDAVPY